MVGGKSRQISELFLKRVAETTADPALKLAIARRVRLGNGENRSLYILERQSSARTFNRLKHLFGLTPPHLVFVDDHVNLGLKSRSFQRSADSYGGRRQVARDGVLAQRSSAKTGVCAAFAVAESGVSPPACHHKRVALSG